MRVVTLRHILFLMLTTAMCFSFSNYILFYSYQNKTEIDNKINEEEQSAGEKSLLELNSFYINESHNVTAPLSVSLNQVFTHLQAELPSLYVSPNTPPPDLA